MAALNKPMNFFCTRSGTHLSVRDCSPLQTVLWSTSQTPQLATSSEKQEDLVNQNNLLRLILQVHPETDTPDCPKSVVWSCRTYSLSSIMTD